MRFDKDVEAVVLDPCFSGTAVEASAHLLGCPVEFHPGFTASANELEPDYRGPEIVDLARSLGGQLTPDVIGSAARTGQHDPQALKRVWHCLARFGRTT